MGMKNWEYRTHRVPDTVLASSDRLDERLNAWGAQGFELVSVVYSSFGTTLFFKKPLGDGH